MADECEDGEWLEYSSSSVDTHEIFSKPAQEQEGCEGTGEHLEHEYSETEKLEKIREVLQSSLCQTTSQVALTCKSEDLSLLKGPCNQWFWLKLVSKLNSIRQAKWEGSCLEDSYHKCLEISMNAEPEESFEVTVDHYDKNLFNFHNLNTFSSRLDTGSLSPASSVKELVDKAALDSMEKLDFNDKRKNSSISDTSFDDTGPELEWSDNDVKDPMVVTEPSPTPRFDESEAFADLAKMPYEEIVILRDEIREYTKQYSDVLVIELENRDAYIREKELKNDFISSFLAVQAKIREASKIASSKKKFSLQSNSSATSQSMTTIPYEIQNGGPSSEILEKLIEIMEAMRTDSSNVPTLLTNYILKVLCK